MNDNQANRFIKSVGIGLLTMTVAGSGYRSCPRYFEMVSSSSIGNAARRFWRSTGFPSLVGGIATIALAAPVEIVRTQDTQWDTFETASVSRDATLS